ncbi:YihY/virulence factor BrkB family protein [Novosphingobium panipatense]
MKGASALITALNIAYDEEETRSFIRVNLLAFSIAVGSVLVAILAMIAIAAMAAVEAMFPAAPPFLTGLAKLASYLVVGIVGSGMAAGVYRYGPDRAHAKWKWLTPGSIFASLSWILITFGFGLYVANFGNYDATYGSLGAAMVLLTWLYLSAYTLLLGAELNCEIERQTARDTTTGPELPMGERGAYAADTVAAEVDGNRQASAS